jgi:TRAP-type C4-dicarboxylate transport system substrate-binding protein
MDVQSYLTLTHHSYASSVILCSQGLWESLDSKEKQQFEAVATESARYIAELTRRKTKELQESESEKGLIITTLSDDERKKCVLRYSRYITSLVKRTVLIYS